MLCMGVGHAMPCHAMPCHAMQSCGRAMQSCGRAAVQRPAPLPHPRAPATPAVNGFGLALVIPCVSSIIADYNPPDTRGRAFGVMSLTGGRAGRGACACVDGRHVCCWVESACGCRTWRSMAWHGLACRCRGAAGPTPTPSSPPVCLPSDCSLAGRHGGRILCHQRRRDAADGTGGLALCIPAGERCCCIWYTSCTRGVA